MLLLRSQHMHRNYSTGHEVAPHLVAQVLQFTCFTGTKYSVSICTVVPVQTGQRVAPHLVSGTQLTCFAGTKVQILTLLLAAQHLRSEEEHFLRWVAGKKLQGLSEGEGGVKEGKVGGEEEQVVEKGGGEKVEVAVAGAAAVVLEALRKVRQRRREGRA